MNKDKIKAIIGSASGGVAVSLFHFLSAKEEAEITRELGDKYGEIAEEMGEEREKSGKTKEVTTRVLEKSFEAEPETEELLREFLDTENVEKLEEAKKISSCGMCVNLIQEAINAFKNGKKDRSKGLVLGYFTIGGNKFKSKETE